MKKISIQVKITGFIVLSLLIIILIIISTTIPDIKNNLLSATDRTLLINTEVVRNTLRTIMLNGEAPIAVRTLITLNSIKELESISILRPDGSRAFHDYQMLDFVNQQQSVFIFEKTPRIQNLIIDNNRFQTVLSTQKPLKIELSEQQSMEYFFPLLNRAECGLCHGQDQKIMGIIQLKISIRNIYHQIKQMRLFFISIYVISGIFIATLMILFLRRTIVSPLKIIGSTLLNVGKGNFDLKLEHKNNDELGIIADQTNKMIVDLKDRTEKLQLTQDVTIHALASLAETRDNETGAHIHRTQAYVRLLANHLKTYPTYADFLTDENIELLYKSAPLHDIGKVGVPDAILLKPGKLTDEEFKEMKKHTVYGRDAIEIAEKDLGSNSFLRFCREIAYSHHEKWNGSGYPLGISKNKIPISGRLMAVADVYDALISKRVYKPAFPHEKAIAIITEGKGTHFDPEIVDAFLSLETEVKSVAEQFNDNNV